MITRHRPAGVTPLELYDALTPGPDMCTPLHMLPPDAQPPAIARLLASLASPIARSLGPPVSLPPLSQVILVGGAPLSAITSQLCPCAPPVATLPHGPFAAAVLARPALSRALGPGPLTVIDLGQTSLKLVHGDTQVRLARDLSLLPHDTPSSRPHLVAFLADALASLSPPPRALALALPCEIADDLTLGPCTYPTQGDRSLVADALSLCRHDDLPTLVLNDAELAALAALETFGPAPAARLVLTIGFGLGAALLEPRR